MTKGTTRNTKPVKRGLVTISIVVPPKNNSKLRNATDTCDPTTDCNNVVSVVKRDKTSPTRVVSKNWESRLRTCPNTSRRMSATTFSPIQETRKNRAYVAAVNITIITIICLYSSKLCRCVHCRIGLAG